MIEKAKIFIDKRPESVNVVALRNDEVVTDRELRKACEQNACGHFGKNWMCPPDVGEIDVLIEKIRNCGDGVLIQSIHTIEDSFDFEGMMDGSARHKEHFDALFETIAGQSPEGSLLGLDAGHCRICEICTCKENEPCRFPDRAVASVESHGMDVNGTLTRVGLKYNNGPNTVSYVGIILNR